MNVQTYSIAGSKGADLALTDDIFAIEPNAHVVYMAVRQHLASRRQGTSKAKERAEVRGGGKKPWRQKGRGTARAGSSRSPLWVGGGTIFGPRPRDYRFKLPTKVRQLARKSAYAMKAQDGQVMVVDDFSVAMPKTREVVAILKALSLEATKTLLLVPAYDAALWRAGRNIPTLRILEASKASAYDILNNQTLLIQKSALPVIEQSFTKI
ncbi:MAG: 50S ribosomal protein L4 [Ignavibacteria bacterium]|jgi:large subunit ribosomal protein L4|nr:50S ribosomal protein L4 [Ignavibacteria bacterium]